MIVHNIFRVHQANLMKKETLIPLVMILVALVIACFVLLGPGPQVSDASIASAPEESKPVTRDNAFGDSGVAGGVASLKVTNSPSQDSAATLAGPATAQTSSPAEIVLGKIDDAIVTYSPEGVGVIAPYLSSGDPEIRAAAIEGLKQLDEPEGAKVLRRAAGSSTNPRDKKELLEAAEFIELPPVQVEWVQQ
jgi:hypothetical protein